MTNTIEQKFEYATRTKLRFQFKGQISVEDLWDLTPQELDAIYKSLNAQAKQSKEESLLQVKTAADKVTEVKIDIVKYIVNTKLAEAQARQEAVKLKQQEQKVKELIAAKQEASLENKSEEELAALLKQIQEKQQQI